ncbi:MAG TPA: nicotinamide mononucleotide transporter [Planctomycetota bacterium]|nr:nicotinamide mononucleotide transporter [Planctomycetota bacterium]HRR82931.1 nicotinamide mononucleotide transporter [Planctomycetota bacterium]HRT94787.1 nicotinamide mononucleotide transporter [Planctomycetota bacterium]
MATTFWLVTVGSLVGAWLNARQRRAGFAVWMCTNTAWAVKAASAADWPQAAQWIAYTLISLHGWIVWGRKERA